MRLDGIQIGDIVEVDRLGRRFHALVTGNGSGGVAIQPLTGASATGAAEPKDVVGHSAKRGRPRGRNEPLEPSPLQLELAATITVDLSRIRPPLLTSAHRQNATGRGESLQLTRFAVAMA